jgi:hypothetical protein
LPSVVLEAEFDPDEDAIREAVAILLPSGRGSGREAGMAERHRTHSVCDECYAGLVDIGDARIDPQRAARPGIEETCCSCGNRHTSGLYITLRETNFTHCAKNAGIGLP